MDREALEHSLVRRLLDHVEQGTTDLADDRPRGARRRATRRPTASPRRSTSCSSGSRSCSACRAPCPRPGSYRHRRPVRHAGAGDAGHRRAGAGHGQRLPPPRRAGRRRQRRGPALHLPVPRLGVRHRGHASSGPAGRRRLRGDVPRGEGPGRAAGRRGLRAGGRPPAPGAARRHRRLPRPRPRRASSPCSTSPTGSRTPSAHVHPVGANWKVTLDTFRENYHFDYLHRTRWRTTRTAASSPSTRSGATCATARPSARSTSCVTGPRTSGAT